MTLKPFLAAAIILLGVIPFAAKAADIDKAHAGAAHAQPYVTPSCSSGGPIEKWSVQPDEDLQTVLTKWTERSGWHLQWQSEYSFAIGGSATFRANFTSAIGSLLSAMQEARPSPVAEVYRENCVIIITDGLTSAR